MHISATLQYLLAVCLASSSTVYAQSNDTAVPADLNIIGVATPEGGVVTGANVTTTNQTKVNSTVVETFDPNGIDPNAPEALEACPTYAELNIEGNWTCMAEALAHDSASGVWAKLLTNYTHALSNKDDFNFISARHPASAPDESRQAVCAFSNFLSHPERQRAACASVESGVTMEFEFGRGCEPKTFRYSERSPFIAAPEGENQTLSYAATAECVRLVTKAIVTGQVVVNETVSEVVAEVVRPMNATGAANSTGAADGIDSGTEDVPDSDTANITDGSDTTDDMDTTVDGMDTTVIEEDRVDDPATAPFQSFGGSATIIDVDGADTDDAGTDSEPEEIVNTPSTPGLQFVDDES
ncbi:hypothetical protein SARC_09459 [Sphaeroforma arctica JP610]|uniref:Uncharacterized protein n=1 Tax=Sphaeroforma arctica JP610 TaxID=667725 RepID=A0A0L0FNS7_9EUKA|nr:hypothetical protein SARC_09459 [Sphaeroforma arctica JP610]KNC78091.1 hypothetical protein SARC_09459 [Sphaeroforma arctica JP610]|eukprot:XP_014151993.1 hypothetical protein SARC_09459 [Sphaeroforma arctica JP610]